MMTSSAIFRTILTTTICIIAAQSAFAAQVYTWTDENGVVHYTDKQPDNSNAVSMDAPEAYRPGSEGVYNTEATAATPAPAGTTDLNSAPPEEPLSYADQKRQEMAQRREQQQKEQEQRAIECATAQQRLAQIEPNRRVFYTDDNGETVRMDDEDRVAEVAEMHDFIDKNCQ